MLNTIWIAVFVCIIIALIKRHWYKILRHGPPKPHVTVFSSCAYLHLRHLLRGQLNVLLRCHSLKILMERGYTCRLILLTLDGWYSLEIATEYFKEICNGVVSHLTIIIVVYVCVYICVEALQNRSFPVCYCHWWLAV